MNAAVSSFAIEALQRQNAELRAQLDEQDETIRQLRALLASDASLPTWMPRLTPLEEATVRMLIKREVVTAAAFQMLRGLHADIDGETNLRVHISRLRRKLVPHGISILTYWARGYCLDAESRELLSPRAAA